jgi:hypothetical protein
MQHAMAVDREVCLRCGLTAQQITEQRAFECEPEATARGKRERAALDKEGKRDA